MNVVIDDELFAVSKSLSPAVTVAVFASCPCAVGVTVIVITALVPDTRLPKLHVTVVVPLHVPWVADDDPKVTPAGKVSVMMTFVAAAGPLFVATMRYERGMPTCPGFGEAVLTIDRSAVVALTTLRPTDCECVRLPDCASTLNE